ncbi:hypothetical protein WJ883_12080, partial [Coxiella burnetii]
MVNKVIGESSLVYHREPKSSPSLLFNNQNILYSKLEKKYDSFEKGCGVLLCYSDFLTYPRSTEIRLR